MQGIFTQYIYFVILGALAIQLVWILAIKKGRNKYAETITTFREPSSLLARYYDWRLSATYRVVVESLIVGVVSLSLILVYTYMVGGIFLVSDVLPYVALLVVISILGSIQMARRVKRALKVEKDLSSKLEEAVDKIGTAKEIVEKLKKGDDKSNSPIWFALFRISQKQNKIGWSTRDVLLEEIERREQRSGHGVQTDLNGHGPSPK